MIISAEFTFLLLKAHPAPGSPELKFKRGHHKLFPLAVQEVISSHLDLHQGPELLTATHWQHSDPRGNQGTFFFTENQKWENIKWRLLGIIVMVRGEDIHWSRCKWENRFQTVYEAVEALNGFWSGCYWQPFRETMVPKDFYCVFNKKWTGFSSKRRSTVCPRP